MNLVLSDEAKRDLTDVGDYIARDDRTRALTFVQELRVAILAVAERPHAFPIIPRYAHLGIRRRTYGNYLIFYRSNGAETSIIRILHSARDYEALLDIDD